MNYLKVILILFSTIVLTNLDLMFGPKDITTFRNSDEVWYGLTLHHLETGSCNSVPVSFKFENTVNFHSCHFLKFLNFISPFQDPVQKLIWLKLSAKLIILFLFYLLGTIFLKSSLTGYLFGLCFIFAEGFTIFKPIYGTILEFIRGSSDLFIRSNRFISPLNYFSILLAFLTFYLSLFLPLKPKIKNICFIFCILLCYLSSLTAFYAWIPFSYFMFWIFVFSFNQRDLKKDIRPLIVLVLFFILCGIQSYTKMKVPYSSEVLPRSGFFSDQWSFLYVFDKGFILTLVVLTIIMWKSRVFKKLYIPFFILGLYLIMNINLLTGKDFQNFHFKDYLSPLIFGFMLWLGFTRWPQHRKVINILLMVSAGIGFANYLYVRTKPSELVEFVSVPDYSQVTQYLQKNNYSGNAFCGPFYQTLPLETALKCSWHHLLMTYPINNENLLDFTQANFYLMGYSPAEAQVRISRDADPKRSMAVWSFGAKNDWLQGVSPKDTLSVQYLNEKIIPNWIDSYNKVTIEKALDQVSGAELFILKTDFAERHPIFVPIEKFSVYGIYKLLK